MSVFIQLPNETEIGPETQSERKTFTWLGCPPSNDVVNWVKETSFTDVAVRAWSEEANFTEWYDLLEEQEVTMWAIWGFYSNYAGPTDIDGFTDLLVDYVTRSPSGLVYLDDCHSLLTFQGLEILQNLLTAVRNVQTFNNGESNIIVCYYETPPKDANFTDIDLDIYSETDYWIRDIPEIDCNSLGAYVWSWRQGWEQMNLAYLRSQYSNAKEQGFRRITAWSGYESDYYPSTGMFNANLFNFPSMSEEIRVQNDEFLRGG